MTDWELVSKGLLGLFWIMECNEAENKDKTILDLYSSHFGERWEGERLLNTGVLMMSSYLLFVYPQQSDFDEIIFENIDISKFNIISEDNDNSDVKRFCIRLRNSISHSKFEINNLTNIINFKDNRPNDKDKIEFEIGIVDFGDFISRFALTAYNQLNKMK